MGFKLQIIIQILDQVISTFMWVDPMKSKGAKKREKIAQSLK